MHGRAAQAHALLPKPLLMLDDGSVRVVLDMLLPTLGCRFIFLCAESGRFALGLLGRQVLGSRATRQIAADAGGGNAEALSGFFLAEAALDGGEDALSQVQGVGLHDQKYAHSMPTSLETFNLKWKCYMKRYATDLTDSQWKLIAPLLPAPKPRSRPQTLDRRQIVNAIFYLLRTGCQWCMLPCDMPSWSTIYRFSRTVHLFTLKVFAFNQSI
jgi:hypothetical protein